MKVTSVLLLGFVALSVAAHDLLAGPVLRLSPENLDGGYIGRSLEYIADPTKRIRLAELPAEEAAFAPLDADAAHFGFGNPAAYWFRLNVENPGDGVYEWILDLDYVFIDRVEFFRPDPRQPGAFQTVRTGDRRPFAEREIEHNSFAFHVRTPPGRHVYYLRLYNPPQARFPVRAWAPGAFTAHRLAGWMSAALIFGGLLILFLSNLLLFATVRNPAYLYLLVFIPGLALLYLLLSGFGFQYFWPNWPALNESMITVVSIMAFGFVIYLRQLLETPILAPRLDRALMILLGICAGFTALNLFVPYARLAAVAALAGVPVLGSLILATFGAGIAAIGADRPAGKFYLLGAALFALTIGVAVLGLLHITPESPGVNFFARLCSLVLTALMTVGVHYKMKLLRDNLQKLNARKFGNGAAGQSTIQTKQAMPAEQTDPALTAGDSPKQRPQPEGATDDSDGASGNWTIGPRMEQKLQQALFYLKENFRSEISREGLAAQLEVNPDNLGRFFLMYTGDKLGDYTNKLRIEAAARRLHEGGDVLISEVAAEVGFENVSTFNRIFKKIMGSTPSDYRSRLEQSILAAQSGQDAPAGESQRPPADAR